MKRCAGFTIVEMMVALSLSAVAAAVVFTVFLSTQGAYFDTRDAAEVQSESRIVVGLFSQDVRAAGSDLFQIGVQRLVVCDALTVRLQSDIDGDGLLDAAGEPAEDITWSWSPDTETLTRGTPSGQFDLLQGVTDFRLTYLDAAGNQLNTFPLDTVSRNQVRAIGIDMTAQIMNGGRRSWSTVIALRNDPPGL